MSLFMLDALKTVRMFNTMNCLLRKIISINRRRVRLNKLKDGLKAVTDEFNVQDEREHVLS